MAWTIHLDIGDTETSNWDLGTDTASKAEMHAWSQKPLILNPNTDNDDTIANFGGFAVEDLDVFPEDLDLNVEDIQADFTEWTIIAEAD